MFPPNQEHLNMLSSDGASNIMIFSTSKNVGLEGTYKWVSTYKFGGWVTSFKDIRFTLKIVLC